MSETKTGCGPCCDLTEKESAILKAACCPPSCHATASADGKPLVGGVFGDWAKKFETLKLVAGELKVKGYSLGEIIDVIDQALLLCDAAEPAVEEIVAKVKELIDAARAK
jgi:hypothetical protein